MHLVEQYALSCGVKIDKPHIETSFFPIPFEKYITVHASSGMESKNYDYYNDVIELIYPYLQKENINIIQIGAKDDRKLLKCEHMNGSTTIRQTAYIIENSLLHFGNDSFSTHVASGFDKKIVCLYSILYKECCGPYWGNKDNHVLLESHRNGLKPSFSNKEKPKTVNLIMPEEIACGILNLLKIPHNLDKIETIHIGKEYHEPSLSVVPNHIMPPDFMPGHPVNIWAHEFFDEQNIVQWAYNRKCNIFLNQIISVKYLNVIRKNIHQINYFIQEDTDPKYFKVLERGGIKFKLLCEDEDKLNYFRLKFFDWNIFHHKKTTKKDLDNINKVCDNTRYKSLIKIMSNAKIYNSKAAWKRDEQNSNTIIDCPEFWEQLNSLTLYNEK